MMNASEYLRTLYSDFLSIGKFLHEDYLELIKGCTR